MPREPGYLEHIPSYLALDTFKFREATQHHSSPAMFIIVVQAVIVYAISCALWKLLRRFFVSSALDNIPGPPSRSLLFGDCFESLTLTLAFVFLSSIRSPGVFPQIFNIKGWEFHKEITQKCRNILISPINRMLTPCRWGCYQD